MRTRNVLVMMVGAVGLVFNAGCSRGDAAEASVEAVWAPISMEKAQNEHETQMQRGVNARDALGSRLMDQLTGAIKSDGPEGAVGICNTIAPDLATQISEEFGVSIGRTSHKLRNQRNTGPEWMRTIVEGMVEEPSVFASADGTIAAAYPIRIAAPCLLCHGDPDAIIPGVRDQLATHYPEDKATGFGLDDLRGWFWIEVPEE